MPMQWSRGRNPYAFNHLAVLGLGAGLTRPMIAQQRQNLTQRLTAGQPVEVAGQPINQTIVGEAARQLHLAAALAEELLLAHPHHPPQATASADDLAQLKKWTGLTV